MTEITWWKDNGTDLTVLPLSDSDHVANEDGTYTIRAQTSVDVQDKDMEVWCNFSKTDGQLLGDVSGFIRVSELEGKNN